jgi:predicted nucleic acid-binding protein
MNVVADTNVFVSAIFWPGESRRCFALWARRRFHLAITVSIFEEYTEIARRVGAGFSNVNPDPWLKWIENKAKVYEPAPLGKSRSRDPDATIRAITFP